MSFLDWLIPVLHCTQLDFFKKADEQRLEGVWDRDAQIILEWGEVPILHFWLVPRRMSKHELNVHGTEGNVPNIASQSSFVTLRESFSFPNFRVPL
jgi:hypothetical protein